MGYVLCSVCAKVFIMREGVRELLRPMKRQQWARGGNTETPGSVSVSHILLFATQLHRMLVSQFSSCTILHGKAVILRLWREVAAVLAGSQVGFAWRFQYFLMLLMLFSLLWRFFSLENPRVT